MLNEKLPYFFYGGDYNPDQWPDEITDEDIRLMKVYNVNTVTLPVFSWAKLQISEDIFDFSWLDKILNKLMENDIRVILATPTAALPAWMCKKYKDVLKTDKFGRKQAFGQRNNYCPNSPNYRKFAALISEKMAQRYTDYQNIIMWHISNEYGPYCYCENCRKEFINWLKERYKTLDRLNEVWNTAFWGHTFYDWDEIETVSALSELLPGRLAGRDGTTFQGMAVDYNRFMSDSLMNCFLNEKEAVKKYTPNIPVTTNIWGIAPPIDLFKWAKHTDISSWDNYPSNIDHPSTIAFRHDVIRGLKNGNPFLLMEQTPNQQNWQNFNALKRPGVMRLQSYQAIAHGADGIMFFQWRQSRGACEKFHAAMVPHAGHEDTRIGKELKKLGEELYNLKDAILESRINSKIAIIIDWSNWWALEYSSGPSVDLKYIDQILIFYRALYDMNIPVDIISTQSDLSKYDIVIAPTLYMVDKITKESIENYVENGGNFITTYFSGISDENDLVILGGYPGAFRKLLGIWIEETDALYPDMQNTIVLNEKIGELEGSFKCDLLCDVLHTEGAKTLAVFGEDYYKGSPCITENAYGKGRAIYIASRPEMKLASAILKKYIDICNIKPLIITREGVEVTKRVKDNEEFIFILNHNSSSEEIDLKDDEYIDILSGIELKGVMVLEGKGVAIIKKR